MRESSLGQGLCQGGYIAFGLELLLLLEQGVALGHLAVEVAELRLRIEGQVLAAVVETRVSIDADEVFLAGLRVAIVAQLALGTDIHLGCDAIGIQFGCGAVEAQIGLSIAASHKIGPVALVGLLVEGQSLGAFGQTGHAVGTVAIDTALGLIAIRVEAKLAGTLVGAVGGL